MTQFKQLLISLSLATLLQTNHCALIITKPAAVTALYTLMQSHQALNLLSTRSYGHQKNQDILFLESLYIDPYIEQTLKHWDITKDPLYLKNPARNEKLANAYGKLIKSSYTCPIKYTAISKEVGNGILADTTIEPGHMICECTGILRVDSDIVKDSDWRENKYLWNYPTVLSQQNPETKEYHNVHFCIDTSKAGNFSRFINRSTTHHQNVVPCFISHNNLWHLVYFAIKTIKPGQQLLTSYGNNSWGSPHRRKYDVSSHIAQ